MKTDMLNLQTLRDLLTIAVKEYQRRELLELPLDKHDAYLAIGTDEMFDVYSEPEPPFSMGSISDDLQELKRLTENNDEVATAVDIERIGNLLRAFSQILVD